VSPKDPVPTCQTDEKHIPDPTYMRQKKHWCQRKKGANAFQIQGQRTCLDIRQRNNGKQVII